MDREPWFEPKSLGYGAGLPIHRKGWALLGAYVAGMLLSALLFTLALPALFGLLEPKAYGYRYTMAPGPLALFTFLWLVLAVLPMTAGLLVIARARTRGGWRWRWKSGSGADGE